MKNERSVDTSIEFYACLINIGSVEEDFLDDVADAQAPANIVACTTPSSCDQNAPHGDTLVSRFVLLWE